MLHLLLELLEGNHSGTENQAQKKKNISHILSTKTFSQWLLNLRVLCAALLIFFFFPFFFFSRDGAEKMRSGLKVYVLPQLEGNVS